MIVRHSAAQQLEGAAERAHRRVDRNGDIEQSARKTLARSKKLRKIRQKRRVIEPIWRAESEAVSVQINVSGIRHGGITCTGGHGQSCHGFAARAMLFSDWGAGVPATPPIDIFVSTTFCDGIYG